MSHYNNRYFKRWDAMLKQISRARYSHSASFLDIDPIEPPSPPPSAPPTATKKRKRGRPSRASRRVSSGTLFPPRSESSSPAPVHTMKDYTSLYEGAPDIALVMVQMLENISSAFRLEEEAAEATKAVVQKQPVAKMMYAEPKVQAPKRVSYLARLLSTATKN